MYWNEIRDVLIDGMVLGDDGVARAAIFLQAVPANRLPQRGLWAAHFGVLLVS